MLSRILIREHLKKQKDFKFKRNKSKLITSKKYSKFYKSYFINKKYNIPLIDAKIAQSKDYFTINKKDKWITNETSRNIVHFLRSKYDCILSTSKSINKDNSLLNCRIEGFNNNKPDLFIIDLKLKLKKKLLLNKYLKKRKTYLVTSKINAKKTSAYKKLGYKIILVNDLKNKNHLYSFYKNIYKMGYARVFVETGLTFLNYLLKNKLVHELYIFKSDRNLNNNGKTIQLNF